MKKRMFITTIVMALVIIMAMTTATFAWFSTNQTLTVSGLEISARTVEGAQLILRGYTSSTTDRTFDTWGSSAVTLSAAGTLEPLSGFLPGAKLSATNAATPSFACASANADDAIFHKASAVVIDNNQPATVQFQKFSTSLLDTTNYIGVTGNLNFVTAGFQVSDANFSNPSEFFTIKPTLVVGEDPEAPTTADILLAASVKIAFYQVAKMITSTADTVPADFATPKTAAQPYELVGIWAPFAQTKAKFVNTYWAYDTIPANTNNTTYISSTGAIDQLYKTTLGAAASTYPTYSVTNQVVTPGIQTTAAGVGDGFLFKLGAYGDVTDIVIVIWLDGLDEECVNGASGGKLSLLLELEGQQAA